MVEQFKEWAKMIENIPQEVLVKMDVNLLWELNRMKTYFEEQIVKIEESEE